jgi:hypothetical protein
MDIEMYSVKARCANAEVGGGGGGSTLSDYLPTLIMKIIMLFLKVHQSTSKNTLGHSLVHS